MGGMIPLKRLRYGSHSVLHLTTAAVNINSQMPADKEPEMPLGVVDVNQTCHAAATDKPTAAEWIGQTVVRQWPKRRRGRVLGEYLRGDAMTCGGFGNQVRRMRTMMMVL